MIYCDSDDIYLLDYGSADEDAFSWSRFHFNVFGFAIVGTTVETFVAVTFLLIFAETTVV